MLELFIYVTEGETGYGGRNYIRLRNIRRVTTYPPGYNYLSTIKQKPEDLFIEFTTVRAMKKAMQLTGWEKHKDKILIVKSCGEDGYSVSPTVPPELGEAAKFFKQYQISY